MKDAAAKIAETFQPPEYANDIEKRIRAAIRGAVKAERDRCVKVIKQSSGPGATPLWQWKYVRDRIIEAINTPAKKRPSRKK
jgi:adenine C2-methylase RlmN of 23S rRNA A2503 and tRNA A37